MFESGLSLSGIAHFFIILFLCFESIGSVQKACNSNPDDINLIISREPKHFGNAALFKYPLVDPNQMKKLLLNVLFAGCLLAISTLTQNARAQGYLLNETFETFPTYLYTGQPNNGWTSQQILGDSVWDRWLFDNYIGYDVPLPLKGKVALADVYNGGYTNQKTNNGNEHNLKLISPVVSTVGMNNLQITWDELYMQLSASQTTVDVSIDGGSSWTNVYFNTAGAFYSTTRTLNLDAYIGQSNLRIRFGFYSPLPQPPTIPTTHGYWMIDNVKLFTRFANDVGVQALLNPRNNACPNATQSLGLRITNYGTSTANNINVNLGVSGATSGNFSTSIGSLGAGSSTTVFSSNTINTTAGGTVNFTGYTTYGGDQTTTNDSLVTSIVTAPTPTDPSGPPITRCGVGPVALQASAGAGETTVWYNDANTTTALGAGNPFNTPSTVYASRQFFAENTRTLPVTHTNYFTGVYRWNQNTEKAIFFDLTATNELVLDSFASNFAYAGTYLVKVYYKSGTFVGNATNQSAFTLLATDTIITAGLGRPGYIDLKNTKLRIGAGNTYGFVVTVNYAPGPTGNPPEFAFKLGVISGTANDDLSIYSDGVANQAWTSYIGGYCGDVKIFYQKVCKSQRKPIDVIIIPRPTGVAFTQGAPVKGLYRSGSIAEPDVVRLNDTFVYELTPPSPFSNSNFGTSWMITAFSFQTPGGMPPNSADTLTNPPSILGPGRLRYIPTSGVDSVLRIRMTVLNMTTMCDTTVDRYILVGADPKSRFSVSTACEGDVLPFTNASSIASGSMTFKWYFGDGDSSELAHPKHTYSTSGSYNVRLIAKSNYGFVSVFDSTILVYEIPTADFSAPTVCDGATHQFTNSSSIPSIGTPTFEWDFGDGSPLSALSDPSHQYTTPTYYPVRLTVDVNGCKHSVLKYATLAPRAVVSFTAQTSCNNAEAVFSNGSSVIFGTYGSRWKFGDGTQATSKNPKHKYSAFGNVSVTLIVTTDLGCMDSVTNGISLIEAPNADFSLASVCSDEVVQINNLTNVPAAGANGYMWDFGNGNTSTLDNPTFTFPGPGVYTVKLWAGNTNGCNDSVTKQVTIDTKPIAGFVAEDVCEGETSNFLNSTVNIPNGATYSWNLDNGKFSQSRDTSLVYGAVGAYDVYLFVSTPNGCLDTAMQTINVNAVPSSTFTSVTASKGDGSMYFEGPTGTGLSYQWFLGDGNKETVRDFIHKYPFMGTYTVQLVVTSSAGCSSSTTQYVSVNPSGLVEKATGLRVYPNPSTGEVNIDMTALTEGDVVVNVRDIIGKTVYVTTVKAGDVHRLDLGYLAPGSYVIEAIAGMSHYSEKIVITH